jgi:ParB-like chromosome segregation protein Spo0J
MNTNTPTRKPSHSFVQLTPELAEKWLGQNIGNRNLRRQKVQQYARDMREGNWHTSGQAIQLDWNGRLIDGQHRLEAVIESGVTVEALIVEGLDPRAREVIDTGAKRTASDALKFAGHTQDATLLAAVARIADARENGYLRTAMATTVPQLSNSDVIAWVELNPDVASAMLLARRTGKAINIQPSVWAYCLHELQKVDVGLAAEFAESIADMRLEGKGDPRKVLLDIFHRAATGQRRKPGIAEGIYIVYRAWNAWVAGQQLTQIIPGKSDTGGNEIPKLLSK